MPSFSAVTLLNAILLCAASSPANAADVGEIRFAGTLSQPTSDGSAQILRRFDVLLLSLKSAAFFSILDDERGGCPWPESFGILGAAAAESGSSPHLIYSYDGNLFTLPLPPLQMDISDDARSSQTWTSGVWTFEITGMENVDGVPCLRLAASERRGRRQSLLVEAAGGLLRKARQDVFMGQGDQFELTMARVSEESLAADVAQRVETVASALLQLQATMNRRPDTQISELSPRQIEAAAAAVDELRSLAKGTPLHETVVRIAQDVVRQQRRVAQAMDRQQQLLNQPAPEFSLNLVNGGTLSSESLDGKTVVLHFWNYADKPLSEPYGQVGYLDFLSGQRKSANVSVVGVSVNPDLQNSDSVQSGRRSARKLIEFMNVSYPIGYDDGSLLRAFGDPREGKGDLPLWVVLSPEGKVVHYRTGFYEVDPERGLKELDDVLIKQIQNGK